MRLQDVRVLRTAATPHAAHAALGPRLQGLEISPGQLLKREGATWTAVADLNGAEVVLKAAPLAGPLRRLFNATTARRQWRGAQRLAAAGIPAARPLLLASTRVEDAAIELLVLERIHGPTLLHALACSPSVRQSHGLARQAGALVRQTAGAHLFNRDGKPSNFIVSPDGLVVIDTVGIRRGGDETHLARMLASLFIEPWGVGHRPRRALCMRAVLSAAGETGPAQLRAHARAIWRTTRTIIESHGDPTPRINPLTFGG